MSELMSKIGEHGNKDTGQGSQSPIIGPVNSQKIKSFVKHIFGRFKHL